MSQLKEFCLHVVKDPKQGGFTVLIFQKNEYSECLLESHTPLVYITQICTIIIMTCIELTVTLKEGPSLLSWAGNEAESNTTPRMFDF